jgi:hypothetical protein
LEDSSTPKVSAESRKVKAIAETAAQIMSDPLPL